MRRFGNNSKKDLVLVLYVSVKCLVFSIEKIIDVF